LSASRWSAGGIGDHAKKNFKEGRQVVLDLIAFSWKDGGGAKIF